MFVVFIISGIFILSGLITLVIGLGVRHQAKVMEDILSEASREHDRLHVNKLRSLK